MGLVLTFASKHYKIRQDFAPTESACLLKISNIFVIFRKQ